jgi:hypothetical protein
MATRAKSAVIPALERSQALQDLAVPEVDLNRRGVGTTQLPQDAAKESRKPRRRAPSTTVRGSQLSASQTFQSFFQALASKQRTSGSARDASQLEQSGSGVSFGSAVEEETPNSIVLMNPAETGGPVHYVADNQVYTLQPGEEQVLPCHEASRIEFDRGEDFGPARYALHPGSYAFAVTEKGWDLVASDGLLQPFSTPSE